MGNTGDEDSGGVSGSFISYGEEERDGRTGTYW